MSLLQYFSPRSNVLFFTARGIKEDIVNRTNHLFEAVFDMRNWCHPDFRVQGVFAVFASLCLILAGCGGGGNAPAGKAPADGKSVASGPDATDNAEDLGGSEFLLKSILDMLKLDALGFSSNEDLIVGQINQWQRQSQDKDSYHVEEPLDAPTLSVLKAQLSPDQIKQLSRTAFNKYDIERLRDLLLMNASVQRAASTLKTDLERVESVFRTLVRNSDLVAVRSDDIPLSPFNLYLLGKLTVTERSWLFTELLRQLKVDCVLLTNAKAQGDSADTTSAWDASQPFLIGVLINKQVYLFDPLLGMPLTVSGTPDKASGIATLAQARADPKILRQYDIESGKPYRISAEFLKTPRVLVCGDPSVWSYRFQRLQVAFTGNNSAVISDGLTDRNGQPGLLTRVTNWPEKPWQPDQVGVWSFPSAQLAGLTNYTQEQLHALERTIDPLKMPLKAEIVKGGERTQEKRIPTSQFMLARLEHARGRLNEAVKGYTLALTRLQNPAFQDFPQRAKIAYAKATEDIGFW
ncbi:MAG: hypothetical protein JWM11_5933, partial [Planctomycetaceae bacterium]|nr:hypothetical protein [Planctomycetaceae bacterium]